MLLDKYETFKTVENNMENSWPFLIHSNYENDNAKDPQFSSVYSNENFENPIVSTEYKIQTSSLTNSNQNDHENLQLPRSSFPFNEFEIQTSPPHNSRVSQIFSTYEFDPIQTSPPNNSGVSQIFSNEHQIQTSSPTNSNEISAFVSSSLSFIEKMKELIKKTEDEEIQKTLYFRISELFIKMDEIRKLDKSEKEINIISQKISEKEDLNITKRKISEKEDLNIEKKRKISEKEYENKRRKIPKEKKK